MFRIISSGGLELAVEIFGRGAPLLFAHGLTGNRQQSRLELQPLEKYFQVIIFDQRGHGDSTPVTDAERYHPDEMADDITAILDALGIEEAIVGGESMGAATSLLFALHHPERVSALLQTAPAFGVGENPEKERLLMMARQIGELGMEKFLEGMKYRLRYDFGMPENAVAVIEQAMGSHQPESIAAACKGTASWQLFSDLSPLENFPKPVYLIAWENDPLHPLELAQQMLAAFPEAKLKMLPALHTIFTRPQGIGERYLKMLREESQ